MAKVQKNETKLHIIQLNKLYYPTIGGIERVVQQIAEGLAKKTNMTVLVSAEDAHREDTVINDVQVIRLPKTIQLSSMPVSLSLIHELRKLSKTQDVIHLHMPFPMGDLACLLSGFKGKIVLWWHSDVVRQKKLMLLYKPIMKQMLKRADAIVVATQGHIDGSAYLQPYKEKCKIIPYGVEKTIEDAADHYIAQNSTFVNGQAPKRPEVRFLFVGRLVYYKGCDVLIDAFSKVKGAELTMVGSGVLQRELEKKVQELGIGNRVHFVGKLSEEELYRQYANCDVFVLPSVVRSEAFGLVQIEAMSFGKPVINTSVRSGVPYVSINGQTGLTVKPGDVNELTEAMQWMTDHPEERILMGKQARERVKSEYQLEIMTNRIYELYQEILKE